MAERVGLTVKLTAPAARTVMLPLANTIRAGRHLPPNLMKPLPHLTFLDAQTPNLAFWNVSTQLKVPALASDPVKVIAPVLSSTVAVSGPKALLVASGDAPPEEPLLEAVAEGLTVCERVTEAV